MRAVFVSVVVTVTVTLGRVFLNSLAGYALARLDFKGRKIVFAIVVATLAIPAIVLAIPRFLVLGQLGLLNTWGGLILPLATDAFGIFLMKQFFESVPHEIEEAAKVDGATIFQTFSRVVLPLATPALIALTILSFQGAWNDFLGALIAVPGRPDLFPLPVFLAISTGSVGQARDFPFELAGSILTTVPVAIVFFTFQRYFVQGVAATGVKG
jgi:multiple sugar transport system permease protein